MKPERFTITIEAAPGPTPAIARLRRLLKALLRSFGFRCVSVQQSRPDQD